MAVAVPALLFRMMSGFQALPHVDLRLLAAYFGGTFVVYAAAVALGRTVFALDGAGAAVFGMGSVFAGSMMGTVAGVVVGSAVANMLFGGYDTSPEAQEVGDTGADLSQAATNATAIPIASLNPVRKTAPSRATSPSVTRTS